MSCDRHAKLSRIRQKTLRFINDEATSVHGCVRVSSVFLSESGEWKLGGLETLSSMKEDDAVIYVGSTEWEGPERPLSRSRHTAVMSQTLEGMLLPRSPRVGGTASNEVQSLL